MSYVGEWLAGRQPVPPSELMEHVPVPAGSGSMVELLSDEAGSALDEATRRPGRRRDAAFLLLAADALFTYACEAAAEGADVEASLRTVLERAGTGA